jgi:hypothetical protein
VLVVAIDVITLELPEAEDILLKQYQPILDVHILYVQQAYIDAYRVNVLDVMVVRVM